MPSPRLHDSVKQLSVVYPALGSGWRLPCYQEEEEITETVSNKQTGVTKESGRDRYGELPPPLTDISDTDTNDTGYDEITHTPESGTENNFNCKMEMEGALQSATQGLIIQNTPKFKIKLQPWRFQKGCMGRMKEQKL